MNGQCENVEPLIIEYALGELDPSDVGRVEAHVESCSRCSGALEGVQRIVSLLSEQEVVEPSAAVCHSVKEAVRERFSRPRTPFSAVTAAAESFFRRRILAGATALVLAGMVTVLMVLPGLRGPLSPGHGGRTKIELRGTYLDPDDPKALGQYLGLTEQLLDLLGAVEAQEVLASYDWMTWVSRAQTWKEWERFKAYQPLWIDLEKVYDAIAECKGQFGEEEIARIQNLIAELDLIERTREALESEL